MNGISVASVCKTVSPTFIDCENPYIAYGVATTVALTVLAAAYHVGSSERVSRLLGRDIVSRAEKGELVKVQAMIARSSGPLPRDRSQEALMAAIRKGHPTIFRKLIETGVVIPDEALHCALNNQRVNMIPTLIQGCDLGKVDGNGNSALMIAASRGNERAVQLMLEKGGLELDTQNREGKTALSLASREYPAIVKCLLEAGADANIPDKSGTLPLHAAADQDAEKCIKLLLPKTDNPNHQDEEKNTPLHKTVSHRGGRLKAAELLLGDRRVDPNIYNRDGELPLVSACQMLDGKDELALLMIRSERCNLNLFSKEDPPQTAAHAAVAGNGKGKGILEELGKAGADFTVELEGTPSVLGQAFKDESIESIVHLIETQGAKVLRDFRYRGLNIAECSLVLGSYSVRETLRKKGIYYEGEKREEIAGTVLKNSVAKIKPLLDRVPLKIRELQELIADVEQGKASLKQPFLRMRLMTAIERYIEDCHVNDRCRQREDNKVIEIVAANSETPFWNLYPGPLAPFVPEGILSMVGQGIPEPVLREIEKLPNLEISLHDLERYAPHIKAWLNELIPIQFGM